MELTPAYLATVLSLYALGISRPIAFVASTFIQERKGTLPSPYSTAGQAMDRKMLHSGLWACAVTAATLVALFAAL